MGRPRGGGMARIAVVVVADDSTADHRSKDPAEYCADAARPVLRMGPVDGIMSALEQEPVAPAVAHLARASRTAPAQKPSPGPAAGRS